jgi:hypothetical protein
VITHIDIDRSLVVVACMPDHDAEQVARGTIWTRRFVGVKAGDNPDGTIRVQVQGVAPDLAQSVFWKRSATQEQKGRCDVGSDVPGGGAA